MESAKSCAWRAYVLACLACLRACVLACLACLRACVLTCLRAWCGTVLPCLACLRPYLLACSRAWRARVFDVLAHSRAWCAYVLDIMKCFTFLRFFVLGVLSIGVLTFLSNYLFFCISQGFAIKRKLLIQVNLS